MEKLTQKWAIVSLLEDVPEGAEVHYTDFPLHTTLAGIFAIDKTGVWLARGLTKLLHDQPPFLIEANQKAMFGPDQNVAVVTIKQTPELMDLYKRLQAWLQQSGATYNTPQYEGQGYIPHSAYRKSGKLTPGEKRLVNSVSIIDLYPGSDGFKRKVFKTINLQ